LFRSLARDLGADEAAAATRFRNGYSTLRLLNYPPRPAGAVVGGQEDAVRLYDGVERPLLTVEHEDASCLSLLWQDEKGGLQFQARNGEWLDVPRVPGAVSAHFGDSMGPMTEGLIVATPHRVLGHPGEGRQSLGFFLELDLDAPVAPLPGLPSAAQQTEADTYAAALLKVLARRGHYKDLIDA
jgi:isopenicillin N synthase-like dioxygenase